MIETVDVKSSETLDDYAAVVHYAPSVYSLRTEANALLRRLSHRKIWMVNSPPRGGGVAEMLPKVVSILQELGVPTEWVAAGTSRPEFFELTKRIHNPAERDASGARLTGRIGDDIELLCTRCGNAAHQHRHDGS